MAKATKKADKTKGKRDIIVKTTLKADELFKLAIDTQIKKDKPEKK